MVVGDKADGALDVGAGVGAGTGAAGNDAFTLLVDTHLFLQTEGGGRLIHTVSLVSMACVLVSS